MEFLREGEERHRQEGSAVSAGTSSDLDAILKGGAARSNPII